MHREIHALEEVTVDTHNVYFFNPSNALPAVSHIAIILYGQGRGFGFSENSRITYDNLMTR